MSRKERKRDEEKKSYEAKDHLLSAEQVKSAIFNTLSICPEAARLARTIFALTESYRQLNGDMSTPHMLELAKNNPDVVTTVRLGYYARIIRTRREFRKVTREFLTDLNKHYLSQAVMKRFKTVDALESYTEKYQSFAGTVRVIDTNTAHQVAAWMGKFPKAADLDQENQYIGTTKVEIGDTLLQIAKEHGKQREHGLDPVQYRDLAELIVSIIRQEVKESNFVPQRLKTTTEPLAQVLFDLVNTYEVELTSEQLRRFPAFSLDSYKHGKDLYALLIDFLNQLPEALMKYDHPGHVITRRLVHELNGFEVEGRPNANDGQLFSKMFNYHLVASMIEKDFGGYVNFQEFMYYFAALARREDPNHAWYQDMLEHFVEMSHHFFLQAAVTAEDVEHRIFNMRKYQVTEIDLAKKIKGILGTGDYQTFTYLLTEKLVPIELTALQGDRYTSFFYGIEESEDVYRIQVQIVVEHVSPDADPEDQAETSMKFRYELKVIGGEVQLYMPITNRDELSPFAERAAVEHVKRMLAIVDVDQLAEDEAASTKQQPSTEPANKKFGNREERMRQHQEEKLAQSNGSTSSLQIKLAAPRPAQPSLETEAGDTKSETLLTYPPYLILSSDLRDDVKDAGKKGRYSRIYADLKEFIRAYNTAPAEKPGKGIHMDGVRGPNRETVWRFKSSYKTRCVVVEVDREGQTVGLVIHVDDRNDVYEDKEEMRRIVKAAVSRYYTT